MPEERKRVLSRLAPSFLPATAVLEMTYKCNHSCIFCSCPWEAENNGFIQRSELQKDEWMKFIRKLTGMGVCNIAFTGGEPLLKQDIFEIIEFAATCTSEYIETVDDSLESHFAPPKLYLITNGKLVDENVLNFCKKHNVHLSMSLPGLETYREHTATGNPGDILEKFKKAKEIGISTTVNITVTRKNLYELYETIANALVAGADMLLLNRFLPGGRGLKYSGDLLLNKEQINQMLEIAEEVLTLSNRKGSVGTELPKCIMNRTDYERLQVGTRCSAAMEFFVVGPSGYIRTCNHSPVELNSVNEIDQVKYHPYWKKFILKQYHPAMCNNCSMLYDCDGGCREAAHVYSGHPDSNDPLFCNI